MSPYDLHFIQYPEYFTDLHVLLSFQCTGVGEISKIYKFLKIMVLLAYSLGMDGKRFR